MLATMNHIMLACLFSIEDSHFKIIAPLNINAVWSIKVKCIKLLRVSSLRRSIYNNHYLHWGKNGSSVYSFKIEKNIKYWLLILRCFYLIQF